MLPKDEKITSPNEDNNTSDKSQEIPEDLGSWILEEGVALNDLKNKSDESLANKKNLFDKINGLLKQFQEFYESRVTLYLTIAGLFVLIIIELIQEVSSSINIQGLRFIESIATLILFGIVVYKIATFLVLEGEARTKLGRMNENDDTVQKGYNKPDAIELLVHTFAPRIKEFMETYAAHSDQERLKESLLNSLLVYGISNESIVTSVRKSKLIRYSESSSLSYLISEILKSSNLDSRILELAYYDYVKSPVTKDALRKVVNKKDLRNELISTISAKIRVQESGRWVSKLYERITALVLDNVISKDLEYSISGVVSETEEVIRVLTLNQSTFSNNLFVFGFDLGLEYLEACDVKIESIESLLNGEYLEKCAFIRTFPQHKDFNLSHLDLVYHYNEPKFFRASRLRALGVSDRDSFASYISENVLKINLKVSENTLGQILLSVGDYRIENLSHNFRKIVDALEFLKKAKEALETLEFNTLKNPNDPQYIQYISTSISAIPNNQWIFSWLKFFQELVDWKSELNRMFPEKMEVNPEHYSTLMFLIFSNGKLHLQPTIDKRTLNQHFSNEVHVEKRLLRFIELAESDSPKEIPKLIIECLEFQYGQANQLYLSLFHREFVSGSLPPYYFLVWYSNKGYLEESQQITTMRIETKGNLGVIKTIVDKIFTMTLTEDFVKSLLIGGVVKAYLIIKFSGPFFGLLEHGSKDYRSAPRLKSFRNFLKAQQTDVDGGGLPYGLDADYYYRIDASPHTARLGIVPENMSFLDFSNSLDTFLRKYFASLSNEKWRLSKITKSDEAGTEELSDDLRWEILPLDISTVRKAIEEQGSYTEEKEYVKSIERFLVQEDTPKKLAWIGVMQTRGGSSDNVNLRTVIREIFNSDHLGFGRYMEISASYLQSGKEIEGSSETLELYSKDLLTDLNKAILHAIGVDNFLDGCIKINALTSKNANILEKALSSLQFISKGKNWSLTPSGVDYFSGFIGEISRGVKILLNLE